MQDPKVHSHTVITRRGGGDELFVELSQFPPPWAQTGRDVIFLSACKHGNLETKHVLLPAALRSCQFAGSI